jgi:molybdopterin-guanine dinucleotide biosynthesis protein MobB
MVYFDMNKKILGFIANSGTGKTTLLLKLIPLLKARGLKIAMIKHSHHHFDIDHPGKDSYRLRHAGADQMLIASRLRWALMVELADQNLEEPSLEQLISKLDQENLDLILVEGFKHETIPKIEVHRPSLGNSAFFPNDPSIIAIACDEKPVEATELPLLALNQPEKIVDFIIDFLSTRR